MHAAKGGSRSSVTSVPISHMVMQRFYNLIERLMHRVPDMILAQNDARFQI